MDELEIKELIARGEGYHLEFKEENESNEDFAKTLVCFANTDGGKILAGVDNNGNIKGVNDIDRIMLRIDDVAINRCDEPQKFLPEARVICVFINGYSLSVPPDDKKEITGTIPQTADDIERFLKIYLKEKHEIKDFEPETKFEIPLEALREAVFNAIAHRDYTINAPVGIIIFFGQDRST